LYLASYKRVLLLEKPKKEWIKLASNEIYTNPWITLEEHRVVNPAGKEGIYGKVLFKNTAIGIVPLDEHKNTWLVGQYRYTLGTFSWEIPEGGGKKGTDPLLAAQRELKEETGIIARRWTHLTRLHTSNSVTDEEGFIYLAEDLTKGPNDLEDTEADLVVKKLPLEEAYTMVLEGAITDSISMIGLLLAYKLKGVTI